MPTVVAECWWRRQMDWALVVQVILCAELLARYCLDLIRQGLSRGWARGWWRLLQAMLQLSLCLVLSSILPQIGWGQQCTLPWLAVGREHLMLHCQHTRVHRVPQKQQMGA